MFGRMTKWIREKFLIFLIFAFFIVLGRGIYLNGYDFLYGFSDDGKTQAVSGNSGKATEQGNRADSGGERSYNSLAILIQLFTIPSIILVVSQIKMANDQSRMSMSYELYKENTEIRQLHGQARKQLNELETCCRELDCFRSRADFDEFYADEKYRDIRRMAYHFEYIGYLVKSDKVHFDLIFDPITFPDWLIEGSVSLREKARVVFPDFWEGTEYLYCQYQAARAVSRRKRNRWKNTREFPARVEKALINGVCKVRECFSALAAKLSGHRTESGDERRRDRLEREILRCIGDMDGTESAGSYSTGGRKDERIRRKLKKLFLMYAEYRTLNEITLTESGLWKEFDAEFRGPAGNGQNKRKDLNGLTVLLSGTRGEKRENYGD